MSTFFTILLNTIIVGSILAVLATVFWLSWNAGSPMERAKCFLAILLGVLVIVASRAWRLSYPAFLAKSLTEAKPGGGGVVFLATVIPGGVGVGIGWYIAYVYKKRPKLATRLLALVGTLAAGALAGIYVNATSARGLKVGVAALPNIAFVSGIILFIVFSDEEKRSLGWFRQLAAARASKR